MHDEHGMSLTPMVVILVPALMVMIGLVVDGGAQAAAQRRAEGVAAAAARAAGDDTGSNRLAGATIDTAAALGRARAVLAQRPGVSGEVTLVGGRVSVRTRISTPTILLSLIGVTHLDATGSAEANLVSS